MLATRKKGDAVWEYKVSLSSKAWARFSAPVLLFIPVLGCLGYGDANNRWSHRQFEALAAQQR